MVTATRLDELGPVLDALGDGTRREMVSMLTSGPSTVAGLASRLPVSRPAVSKHLRILGDAGLVTHDVIGREHHYRLERDGFLHLRVALDRMWDDALDAFANHMERQESP